jgi:hypothetical protein
MFAWSRATLASTIATDRSIRKAAAQQRRFCSPR